MVRSATGEYAKKQTLYKHTIPQIPREPPTPVPTAKATAKNVVHRKSRLFNVLFSLNISLGMIKST